MSAPSVPSNGQGPPVIDSVRPPAAIAGGDFEIYGSHLAGGDRQSIVRFGDVAARLVIGGEHRIVVRVPDEATDGSLTIESQGVSSSIRACTLGRAIAEDLHPVASPAVDSDGNIYTTRSGTRGEEVPVSVFKIDTANSTHAFASEIVNPTGLVVAPTGELLVSGRNNGTVYTVTPSGSVSTYAEGMGVATGMAMDGDGNLYVGDRTGTIFKIAPDRQIFVFATVESSIAAFHLAFGPDGYLYLTGPTTSSFDCVRRITPDGDVEEYLRGFGRPQGIAFDREGRLFLAASYQGRKGVFRIDQDKAVTQVVSGPGIVGLAFLPSGDLAITTSNSVYRLLTADWISD
ncbi:MAG: gluconolaconase [Acidobacteria bacterium]|nr:gluconolaconase [Acidobacteriota bacterium]MDA1235010.1 gluconolaconase [Acidobacteriota bacterium]